MTIQESAPRATAPPPRLADGVELIGPYAGSGYREPKYLIGRPDGQVVQVSDLLYRLARLLDGQRGCAELADRLAAELGREVGAAQVEDLMARKLGPAGLLDAQAPQDAAPLASDTRPDHLMMLRWRVPVVPARISWALAGAFRPLHRTPVVVALLAAFVALDAAVLAGGGGAGLVPGALALVDQPALTLAVLGLLIASGAFHECGHVSACRYSGARPGVMGMGVYLVWPAFYSTVTDSYRLSRAGRLRTDLGGVYFNALFMAGLAAAYLGTGAPWLLVALAVLHAETARQFLPSVRLDGYYILSDLIGVADLFTFLGPVLRGALPGGRRDPRVGTLRPAARRLIVAWVLFVVPFIGFFVVSFLLAAPQVLPAVARTLLLRLDTVAAAVRAGAAVPAVLAAVQVVLLALPVLGGTLLAGLVLRTLVRAALGTGPAAARPHAAGRAPLGLAVAAVAVAGLLAGAALDRLTATAGEALVAAGAAGAPGGPWPGPAAGQPVTVQVAAVSALLGGLGNLPVIDAARTVLVLFGAAAAVLVWPAARRIGLPPGAAAAAVVLGGVGPLLLLGGRVDPGGVAVVWLVLAAALAGRGRGPTAAAWVALAAAVLTAPLAAAGVLAFAAHGLLAGGLGAHLPRRGARVLAGVGAAGAATAAVLATGDRAWAGYGAGSPGAAVLAGALVLGAAVVGLSWYRLRALRPVATGASVLLVCAALPGDQRLTALALAAPALGVLAAALLARSGMAPRALLGATAALAVLGGLALLPAAAALPPDRGALAAWVAAQLGPATPVRTDPLTAAQLVRDGVAPGRLATGPGAGVTVDAGRGSAGAGGSGGAAVLARFPDGPGGGPVTVRAAPGPPPVREPVPGAALERNPALTFAPPAAAALRAAPVDDRLAAVLASLAGTHRLVVEDLPAAPGEPAAAPRRTAVLSAVDGGPAASPASAPVVDWLQSQQPPYRPASVTVVGDGLAVRYPVPG